MHNRLEIVVTAFRRGLPLMQRQLVKLRVTAFLAARATHVSNVSVLKIILKKYIKMAKLCCASPKLLFY